MAMIGRKIAHGIQIGAVTHHHDQSIVPTSFSTRKTRNNAVNESMPWLRSLIDFLHSVLTVVVDHSPLTGATNAALLDGILDGILDTPQ